MANIHDYLHWRGDIASGYSPLNEVDALILAKLAYTPFDKIFPGQYPGPVTIREAALALLEISDIESSLFFRDDAQLLRELADSERFSGMLLTDYINRIESENETQFSAITVHSPDNRNYILFRGTDSTLVGWKENFNMSFLFPVPAQISALKYLENAAAALDGDFIIAGHSKGGNLAMYASAFCSDDLQHRISTVYNFDGPGFDEKVLDTPGYQRIRSKIISFIPQASIVGLLLEHEEQYYVVESTEKNGITQHDISSWKIDRNQIPRIDRITDSSRFFSRTVKGWLADMDMAQRETIVDTLYSVLSRTQVQTVQELDDNLLETSSVILPALRELPEDKRKLISDALSLFMKSARKELTSGQHDSLLHLRLKRETDIDNSD